MRIKYTMLRNIYRVSINTFHQLLLQVRLSPQNVLGIKQFASTVGSLNLVKSSDKFLQKHFKAVSESEEFLGAGFDEVSDLVERDELHVTNEEVVFLAVLRWIKQDQESRCEHLPVLLQKVKHL